MGFWDTQFWPRQLETRIQVTPRLAEGNLIKLELVLRHTRQHTPDDTDEIGIGPDGPLVVEQVITDRLVATLDIHSGRHVIAGRIQTDARSPTQLCVIVGAQVAKQSP